LVEADRSGDPGRQGRRTPAQAERWKDLRGPRRKGLPLRTREEDQAAVTPVGVPMQRVEKVDGNLLNGCFAMRGFVGGSTAGSAGRETGPSA